MPSVKLGVIKKKCSVLFVIINSYAGQTPKIYEIYKPGFSTKGSNRGIGLATMKTILSNYFNTVLDTTIENDTFTQTLEIIDSTKGAERK